MHENKTRQEQPVWVMVRKLYAEKEKNDTLATNPSFRLEEQKNHAWL